jgi:hypothetical protein
MENNKEELIMKLPKLSKWGWKAIAQGIGWGTLLGGMIVLLMLVGKRPDLEMIGLLSKEQLYTNYINVLGLMRTTVFIGASVISLLGVLMLYLQRELGA